MDRAAASSGLLTTGQLVRTSRQSFSTSALRRSVLWNLGGLATSRESQYFAKERGLPRTEFSPQLQLIRSSEVDPFGAPGASSPAARKGESAVAATSVDSAAGFYGLVKELETTKRELGNLTAVLASLSDRYKTRDRDARKLSWIVVVLVVGFVFPGWLREPLDKGTVALKGFDASQWLAASAAAPVTVAQQASSAAEKTPPPQPIRPADTGRRSESSADGVLARRIDQSIVLGETSTPVWSKLLWSSPS